MCGHRGISVSFTLHTDASGNRLKRKKNLTGTTALATLRHGPVPVQFEEALLAGVVRMEMPVWGRACMNRLNYRDTDWVSQSLQGHVLVTQYLQLVPCPTFKPSVIFNY